VDPAAILAVAALLLWGALWGSFLNVVVHRVPAGLSVVHPRSRCPACETPIRALDNIPLVSWLWLRGRCRSCRTPIPVRYPLVEAVFALLILAQALPWLPALLSGEGGWQVAVVLVGEQAALLLWVAIALIDAETFLIPDVLSLPMPLLGLALAAAVGNLRGVTWQQAGAAALLGGGGLWLVQWAYGRWTGREGLGFGDVKLLAGIGALLGAVALGPVLFLAAIQGLVFALAYAALSRGDAVRERGLDSLRHLALPFGPFLVMAAIQWLLLHRLAGQWLARWQLD
jgi:leader peptidase (prepilin peptidase)/N-methyltransferase